MDFVHSTSSVVDEMRMFTYLAGDWWSFSGVLIALYSVGVIVLSKASCLMLSLCDCYYTASKYVINRSAYHVHYSTYTAVAIRTCFHSARVTSIHLQVFMV